MNGRIYCMTPLFQRLHSTCQRLWGILRMLVRLDNSCDICLSHGSAGVSQPCQANLITGRLPSTFALLRIERHLRRIAYEGSVYNRWGSEWDCYVNKLVGISDGKSAKIQEKAEDEQQRLAERKDRASATEDAAIWIVNAQHSGHGQLLMIGARSRNELVGEKPI